MSEYRREIVLDGEPVQYSVRESNDAEEPRIDVGIHAIRVVVPAGEPIDPESLLTENAGWVLEKKRKYDEYRAAAPDREFVEGERFPFLGTDRVVRLEEVSNSSVEEDAIVLPRAKVETSSLRIVLQRLYKENAREHLNERVEHFARRMNVEPTRLELRNQRTRWGSCSVKKTLSFNWRLMMAPPKVVDYVVVHELAHLRVEQHTRRFWTLVQEQVPDYPEHVEWLEENSAQMIFDEGDL